MRKRGVYLILLGVLLFGLVVVVCSREREPEYGGKRLSEWIILPEDVGEKAIRQIGTNARIQRKGVKSRRRKENSSSLRLCVWALR